MKKYISFILTAVMLISVTACDGGTSGVDDSDKDVIAGESEPDGSGETEEPASEEAELTASPTTPSTVRTTPTYSRPVDIDNADIVSLHGQLRVEDGDLVDKNGLPYQLRGMSTHGIQWFPQFVNKDAIQTLRDDWKTNVLRLAMYTAENEGYDDDSKERIWGYMEEGIRACIELDMYVIIDWHILNDRTPLKNKDKAVEFFGYISEKYGANENIIYEICNEPNSPASWTGDIKPYAEEIIPIIRENAPDSIIIVGTAQWSQLIDEPMNDPEPLKFDNLMYALHFYADTHKDWLRDKLTECREQNLPIFVTEFGMCDSSGNGRNNFDESQIWLELLDEYNISYINWNLADKEESSSAFKPGANPKGGWSEDELTEGGAWIRDYFRSRVPSGD